MKSVERHGRRENKAKQAPWARVDEGAKETVKITSQRIRPHPDTITCPSNPRVGSILPPAAEAR